MIVRLKDRELQKKLDISEVEKIDEPQDEEPFPGRFYTALMEDGKCIFARRSFE